MSNKGEYTAMGTMVGAVGLGLAGCKSCLDQGPPYHSLFPPFNLITGLIAGAILGAVGGGVIGAIADASVRQAAREQEEAELVRSRREAEARERQRHDEQKAHLLALAAEAPKLVRSLTRTLRDADAALVRAEHEFAGGYLDPFWNAVEASVTQLASYDTIARQLESEAAQYRRQAPSFGIDVAFPIAAGSVPDPRLATERLDKIVRLAQREVSYSQIYHLRKTNQILVSGFSTLAGAIDDLGNRLENSVERLGSSIGMDLERMLSAQAEIVDHLKASREYDAEHRQIMDNIQRRRLPTGASQADRDY